jgi:hypothetical protein
MKKRGFLLKSIILVVLISYTCIFIPRTAFSPLILPKTSSLRQSCISYSTYLGGEKFDVGRSISVDSVGAMYIVGSTSSSNIGVNKSGGVSNIGNKGNFLTKINADGSLNYTSFFGDFSDIAMSLAVDNTGSCYITGQTNGGLYTYNGYDLTYNGGYKDAFVMKLNPQGSIAYSTYLGGADSDSGNGITVDADGACYVAGITQSDDFPTLNSYQLNRSNGEDGFLAKFNSDGSLNFSTFFGGSGSDGCLGVALGSEKLYITGYTSSSNFPILNPIKGYLGESSDAFISEFSLNGSLAFSTYIGGGYSESGKAIDVDQLDACYITGITNSHDFPINNSPFQLEDENSNSNFNIFVMKINSDRSINFSAYIPTQGPETSYDISVDIFGTVYVTGNTQSADFPAYQPIDRRKSGRSDAFIVIFNKDGSLKLSSFIGGSIDEGGYSIFATPNTCYITGYTNSYDFPTADKYNSELCGQYDVFVMRVHIGDFRCKRLPYISLSWTILMSTIGVGVAGLIIFVFIQQFGKKFSPKKR